jgi:hypothetical protein
MFIEVTEQQESGWWFGKNPAGQEGYFPVRAHARRKRCALCALT